MKVPDPGPIEAVVGDDLKNLRTDALLAVFSGIVGEQAGNGFMAIPAPENSSYVCYVGVDFEGSKLEPQKRLDILKALRTKTGLVFTHREKPLPKETEHLSTKGTEQIVTKCVTFDDALAALRAVVGAGFQANTRTYDILKDYHERENAPAGGMSRVSEQPPTEPRRHRKTAPPVEGES